MPRYICYIKNNNIYLKLFNIYHSFKSSKIDSEIKQYQEINSKIILKHSKAVMTKLISQKINGGNILQRGLF